MRRPVGYNDQQFTPLDALCRKGKPDWLSRFIRPKARNEGAWSTTGAQQRMQALGLAVLSGYTLVRFHANNKGNIVFIEEIQPECANKLPISQEVLYRASLEGRQITLYQGNTLGCTATARSA